MLIIPFIVCGIFEDRNAPPEGPHCPPNSPPNCPPGAYWILIGSKTFWRTSQFYYSKKILIKVLFNKIVIEMKNCHDSKITCFNFLNVVDNHRSSTWLRFFSRLETFPFALHNFFLYKHWQSVNIQQPKDFVKWKLSLKFFHLLQLA